MGMSIDEAITALERDIHNARLCGYQIDQYTVAIEIMHKYKKIQEQVELSEKENHKIDVVRMIQIREFIYGND